MLELAAAASGGAAYITDNSSLSVSSSTIQGNSAQLGAGFVCQNGSTLIVRESLLLRNSATEGACIWSWRICKVVLDGVSLRDNKADRGGAVIVGGSTSVAVHNCSFVSNMASINAGAMSLLGFSNATIRGTRFSNNTARFAGALAAHGNSTLEHNSATDRMELSWLVTTRRYQ
ncbi:hypothetical protein OEZ85_002540 [Tetradesmus obliquus]|uniref:Right handed beta helix domain-containing protein n=1 Tax=Tetradesmus obliquus TaxID=3088 RepID=A0ABY8TXW4_TETOB|nr:hypothetical protein OEZ85_002540 [Tetradesmus obliquus]